MPEFDYDHERVSRERELGYAYEEAPPSRPSWFVGRDRAYGILPGSPDVGLRLLRPNGVKLEPAFDRAVLDRLTEGFTPAVEGTFSIQFLVDLLDAFRFATRTGEVSLSVGTGGYLRLVDPTTGTSGFLGPIVEGRDRNAAGSGR